MERFDPGSLAGLDEPVRRHLTHAIHPGAPLSRGTRLTTRGRIKVGPPWLRYRAVWDGDGRSFEWRARAGRGLLRVVDRYAEDGASTSVRLLDRIGIVHADDEDVVRSAAGRAAIEAVIWSPASVLPERGVTWRADADDEIVASWELPPERPEVRVRIDAAGAIRECFLLRWDDGGHGRRGYVPMGGLVREERRFGDLVLPSRITCGWWFDQPQWWPFFEAEVESAEPLD
ncbi:MAG TPA: DUF6544 family protein [Thermoleophilaceae bacterium]|nr:DUF6544 family protein [Thermoleophilaceae bacterium]